MKRYTIVILLLLMFPSCGEITFENMDMYPFKAADETYTLALESNELKPLQIVVLTIDKNVLYKNSFSGTVGGIATEFIKVESHKLAFQIPENSGLGQQQISLAIFQEQKTLPIAITPVTNDAQNFERFRDNLASLTLEESSPSQKAFMLEISEKFDKLFQELSPTEKEQFFKEFNANFQFLNDSSLPDNRLDLTQCEKLALQFGAATIAQRVSVGVFAWSLFATGVNPLIPLASLASVVVSTKIASKLMNNAYNCSTTIDAFFDAISSRELNSTRQFTNEKLATLGISSTIEGVHQNTNDPVLRNLVAAWNTLDQTLLEVSNKIREFAQRIGIASYANFVYTRISVPAQATRTTMKPLQATLSSVQVTQNPKVLLKNASLSNGNLSLTFTSDKEQNYDFTLAVNLIVDGKPFAISSPARLMRGGGFFEITNETFRLANGASCPPGWNVTVTVNNQSIQTVGPGQTTQKVFLENGNYVWNVAGGLINGQIAFTINNTNYRNSVINASNTCNNRLDGFVGPPMAINMN
jgi:hypothetical protein